MNITKLANDLLGETVYRTTLPSGLEVFAMPKPSYSKKYAVYAAKYGSVDNSFVKPGESEVTEVPDGIAHFLEHKLFEAEDTPVFERFARLGASVNAFTSYTITAYLFSCTENFSNCLEELMRFVQNPHITDENVEKEKGIIEQEIRMYEDHPGRRVYTNLLRALYHNNPVRIEIGGTVESIRQISKELLEMCYNTFYHPSNMGLFAVGDFSPEEVFDIAGRMDRPLAGAVDGVRRVYPPEPGALKERRVEAELKVSRPLCFLGVKDPVVGLTGRDLLYRQLLTNVLFKIVLSQSSDLFDDLYQEGIVDYSFSTQYSACPQFAFAAMGGETKEPDLLVDRLLSGLRDLAKAGVKEDDFTRAKRKAIGNFFHAFNSLEYIANGFLGNYFRDILLFDYVEVLESLRLSDLNDRLQEFAVPENYAVSVVLPS